MANLNKVMLIGHIGMEPVVKVSNANGNKRLSFTLATSKKYKLADGSTKEQTEWHNIVGRGKCADTFQVLKIGKGAPIYVEGELTYRQWEKDGIKRTLTEINMSNFQLLGVKGSAGNNKAESKYGAHEQDIDLDGLPF